MRTDSAFRGLLVDNAHWEAGREAADRMDFLRDVVEGLAMRPKSLPSRHLYDAEGSRLFEEIMGLPEYYPTRCEEEILAKARTSLPKAMGGAAFHLVDLGAGNGAKTRILLEYLHGRNALLSYVPVDISGDPLSRMAASMRDGMPDLSVQPIADEYFPALDRINAAALGPKLVLFLGSTIGNFHRQEAVSFLKGLRAGLNRGDALLIGFDLRKDPERILRAYDDPAGVTARFNLNILSRINRELEGDFDVQAFLHHAVYDPVEGVARSYLVSRRDQTVRLRKAGAVFSFEAWEAIHTENAWKYAPEEIRGLAEASGFSESAQFRDGENRFLDALWMPVF